MASNELFTDAAQPNVRRRSLILAGGGMRLAYQAGVLIALEESGIRFTHVDGTSGGIFNTAMLASGLSPHEMADRWRNLKIKFFVSMASAKDYLKPLRMEGYTDADNIRKKVFPQLGIDLNVVRNNQAVNATFNVCNFDDKTVEAIANKQITEDHLIAGVSLPMVMPAIKINDTWYTDAVWIKDANLMEGVRQGSEELWVVWAIGNCPSYLPGALNQYVHMIEMSANGALLDEYRQISEINAAVSEGKNKYGQKKPIRLFVIKPEYPLPLDPDLFFNKIDTRALINMGYADAKRCLAVQPADGVAMDTQTTKMKEPGDRLNFRGTFAGKLLLNGEITSVRYYTYFCFRQADGDSLQLFSSIYIEALGKEIPLFDHKLKVTVHKDHTQLESTSFFLHDGKVYETHAAWKLFSPIDFLLGLEFKRMSLHVFENNDGGAQNIMKGTLRQSIRDRLYGCYHTNVRTYDGGAGGIKKRYSMISKLITHGI